MIASVDAQEQATSAASQESLVSDSSATGIAAASESQSSSTNLSGSTAPDTGLTSPVSTTSLTHSTEAASAPREAAMAATMDLNHAQAETLGRLRTPELLPLTTTTIVDGQDAQTAASATSPMKLDTPYLQQPHQASKRTASGTIKTASSEIVPAFTSPDTSTFESTRSQAMSGGPNRKRISELSAQLKTRLSYAMVKVQHGWENRSLEELEQSLPTPTSSAPARIPMTPTSANRTTFHAQRPSMSSTGTVLTHASPYTDRSRRYAHSPDAYGAQSPASQPAMLRRTLSSSSGEGRPASHSPRTYASFWAQHERAPLTQPTAGRRHAHHNSTSTVASTAPSLAPAAEVVPSSSASKRRSQHGRQPPQLSTSGQAGAASKSRLVSPKTPRQNFLRMPSQQAEKDAVDTLLFMSSPNNSANMKHVSQQGSPLRGEFPLDIRG